MKLIVSTPTALVEEVEDIRSLRAEDETGSFGVLPGHADFITVLPICVVNWKASDGREGFVLVRQGVLTVSGGDRVEIAARGAYGSDELKDLGAAVEKELHLSDEMEDVARTSDTRLHLATIRQIEKVLREGRGPQAAAAPRLDSRSSSSQGVNAP